jgi:hypothetical protein
MNSSIYSADRTTHLRIVTLALAISIAIAAFAISTRLGGAVAVHANEHAGQFHKPGTPSQEAAARSPHQT